MKNVVLDILGKNENVISFTEIEDKMLNCILNDKNQKGASLLSELSHLVHIEEEEFLIENQFTSLILTEKD